MKILHLAGEVAELPRLSTRPVSQRLWRRNERASLSVSSVVVMRPWLRIRGPPDASASVPRLLPCHAARRNFSVRRSKGTFIIP